MKYSIIIPTYNHCDDLLKPCIDSILTYTDMQDVQLVISANGCTDGTYEYLNNLCAQFVRLGFEKNIRVAWCESPLGYARATNAGIRIATGEKIVLLNNDTVLIDQTKNKWLSMLEAPFHGASNCGITGPILQYSPEAGHNFIVFFCAMISRDVIDRIGLLNEDYGIGAGEDTEFCIEAERAGFQLIGCSSMQILSEHMYTGEFPIYHKGEATVRDTQLVPNWDEEYKRSGLLLAKKYNRPYYKQLLMNNYERYISHKGEEVDGRETARYKWAAQNTIGSSVLEIGCSNGYGSQFLPLDVEYTGIDYDAKIIALAHEERWGDTRKFIHADINMYELAFYDTIIAFEVIEHLSNGLEVVEKLKKHCKRLMISVPYKEVPGFWGEHHMLHMLDETHLPGFNYKYVDRYGNIHDEPKDEFMNLMLCLYDAS